MLTALFHWIWANVPPPHCATEISPGSSYSKPNSHALNAYSRDWQPSSTLDLSQEAVKQWQPSSNLPASSFSQITSVPFLEVTGKFSCFCCRKWYPLPGPESGLLPNIQKWIVWGDTCADKARDFIEKGHLGEGTQGNCSATCLTVSGFIVMGLGSGLSLVSHHACAHIWSDSGSFLVVHTSCSQDGFQWKGFWEVGREILWVGISCLFLTPPEYFWLVL